jgi:hypothetical protein
MRILRLEVFEKNELVYIREKPVFAKTQKGIKATNTRLVNWTTLDEAIQRAAICQVADFQ